MPDAIRKPESGRGEGIRLTASSYVSQNIVIHL